MSDKDIKGQLEGLFSDIVPESGVKKDESPPEEALASPIEPEVAEAEAFAGEPMATEAPPPIPAKPEEANFFETAAAQPASETRVGLLTSIRSRLMIALVLAAILPLLVTGIWSLYTLQRANALATERSEAIVAGLGEAAIRQSAEATARQIELYLRTHPEIDLTDSAQLESNTELAQIAVQPVGQTGYTAVFDANGITHFHANPATVGMDMSTLADTLPEFWAIFAASLDGSPSMGYYDWQDADGQIRAKYMSIAPVGDTPLRVAATTYIDEFSQPTVEIRSQLADIRGTAGIQLLVVLGVAALAAFGGAYVLGRQLSGPIRQLADAAARVVAGDLRPLGWQERHDEIGLLARAFNSMVAQVRQTLGGLEERVTERTRALELATDVGRRLSAVRDLDALLGEAVELIRSSFGLYYAQVYLTDSAGRNLVLRAGTGEAGAALIRRGHALPVGPGSINGTAAAAKRAVVVPDTAQSATFLPNPLLPDTRSEMAVPLVVGEQVVGVLNLQHNQPGFLTHESLPAFETLAGQFAVAVDNARLFTEATQTRAEVEAQLQRLAQTGWQDFMDGIHRSERIGYAYAGDTLEPIVEPLAATAEPHVLAAPIQVQKAPVGVIQIEGEAGRAWTEAETDLVGSVARQVAQQVENLRLLAQADQYRAEVEQATRRLTREGWQAYLAAKSESSAGFVYDRYEVKPFTGEASTVVEAGELALTRPLKVRDETIGRLAVGEVEVLDDEAIGLMDAVAGRLSAHIENLRLFEETRTREHELEERGQEMEASQRVTFAATETTDPGKLLDLVVNLIRDQFDLYHTQVYLVDEERQAAVLYKSTGYAGQQLLEQGHQIPLNQPSLVTRAIHGGEPVVRNDVGRDADWMPNPLLPLTKSELVLPLRAGGRMIGALDVQSRSLDFFSPRTVALFQTMAEQVAMSFQTTDLLIRTQQQTEVLTQLTMQLHTASDVAERVSAILDPGELLSEVVTLLQQRFGLYYAHIYLLDGETLKLQAGSGEIGQILLERGHYIPLDREHSLVAQSARNRQVVTVNDTTLDSNFMPNPLLPQTRSEMAVPLIASGQVLGVLDVQDNEPSRFGPTDQDTFTTLAGHVATALDNASLFAKRKAAEEVIRESEERLRLILDSVLAGVVVIDPTTHTITDANLAAAEMIGAPRDEIVGSVCHQYICPAQIGSCPVTDMGKNVDNSERVVLTVNGERIPILKTVVQISINGRPYLLESFVDITERKQAEEAIRAEQQRTQTILETVTIPMIISRLSDSRVLYANQALAQVGNIDLEELLSGHTVDYFANPDDREKVVEILQKYGRVSDFETQLRRGDGSLYWVLLSSRFINYQNDTCVLSLYVDITERKQAEAERERFTLQLGTAADVAGQVASILDPDELLKTVIPLLKEQFGLYYVHVYMLDEVAGELTLRAGYGEPGRIMLERGHKIPLDAEKSLVARAARSKAPVLVNDVTQQPDFMPNPLLPDTKSEMAVPLVTGGKVLGVFDVQHDQPGYFTEADLDVFTTLAGQLATAFQNARAFEETGARLRVSQALAGAQTEEQVLDAMIKLADFYPEAQVALLTFDPEAEETTLIARRIETFSTEMPVLVSPGMHFPASAFPMSQHVTADKTFVSANMLTDERMNAAAREVIGQMGVVAIAVLPITAGGQWLGMLAASSKQEGYFDERKLYLYQSLAEQGAMALRIARLYDETQKTAERLAEVDRLKSEFLASMSHELRTPLNSIIGYTEIMLMGIDTELDPELLEDVQAIYDNGQHLLRIINDVLDLAKIEAGRLSLQTEEVQVDALIEAASSSAAGLLVNKPIEFKVEVQEDLPMVWGDPVRLNQILYNLTSNAVKFTNTGSITLRAFSDDGWICLEVQDTGIGISEADQKHLFERFQQVDGSSARQRQGTGLGLAITRQLVNLHSGTITVQSELDKGSTFTVRLPIQRQEPLPAQPAATQPAATPAEEAQPARPPKKRKQTRAS